jgi:hypothetical protein
MPLLNYTTTIDPFKTIAEVQKALVKFGARSVLTEYLPDGSPAGLAFTIETPLGPRQFALPIHADRVEAVLRKDRVPTRYQGPEQAQRVAWRIMKDWVVAQLAIVQTEMVSLDQVMLPYMVSDDGRTLYELFQDRQIAALSKGAS